MDISTKKFKLNYSIIQYKRKDFNYITTKNYDSIYKNR